MKDPADLSEAGDVTVAHSGHRHHEEVDRVPVSDRLRVREVRQVTGVLKLHIAQVYLTWSLQLVWRAQRVLLHGTFR